MRYFTREIFEAVQTNPPVGHAAWDKAMTAYEAHFESIKNNLPESAREATERTWHDATVVEVRRPQERVLELVLDGMGCPWQEGEIRLTYSGVAESSIPEEAIGDEWLYEEWDVPQPGLFELSVLMQRSEIRIVAEAVEASIGEYSVQVREDHACAANPPPRWCRVVLLDGEVEGGPKWVMYSSTTVPTDLEDEETDEVIVRNPLYAIPIAHCPFCAEELVVEP